MLEKVHGNFFERILGLGVDLDHRLECLASLFALAFVTLTDRGLDFRVHFWPIDTCARSLFRPDNALMRRLQTIRIVRGKTIRCMVPL